MAGAPEGGIVDPTPAVREIIVRQGRHLVEEQVTLSDGMQVVVERGGCAHFHVSYQIDVRDTVDAGDRAHYLRKAITIMKRVPIREDADGGQQEIEERITAVLDQPSELETCYLFDDGMVSVLCTVEANDHGAAVVLTQDFAL